VYKWCATYNWKALDKGYNFSLDLNLIKSLHKKLWAFKVVGVLILEILGHPIWESQDRQNLGVGPMVKDGEYYKGEGDGFP
jgi:hypothetical protein